MKDKAKLTDLLIQGFKSEATPEAETPQGTPPTEDDDTIDIDALEARIMQKIEAKMAKTTPTETPEENPVTETTEE
jgi:hypothetical protein